MLFFPIVLVFAFNVLNIKSQNETIEFYKAESYAKCFQKLQKSKCCSKDNPRWYYDNSAKNCLSNSRSIINYELIKLENKDFCLFGVKII